MATTIRNKLLSSAQKSLEKGNLTRAIKQYNKLLDLHPDDVRVRLRIGDLQARLGKRREAIETYEQVAEEYYYQGFYLKSVAVLKQILRLDSTRTDIQVRLAELYQQLNLVSDGMAQYRAVAQRFRERGETDRYVEVLSRLVQLDPDDVKTLVTMGEQLSQLGRVDEAADGFAKAADRLFQTGRLNEYTKVAERYLFHRTGDTTRVRRLIRVYLDRGDTKRALAKLQMLFKVDAKDVEGLELLAEAFLQIGKQGKSVKVLLELADVYTQQGQEELAMETYRRVVSMDPGNDKACTHLGIAPATQQQAMAQQSFIPVEPLEPLEDDVAAPTPPSNWRRVRPASGLFQMPTGLVTCAGAVDDEQEEHLNRLLVEAAGYAKVGLNDHASAALRSALEIDPRNITVREHIIDFALAVGDVGRATLELSALARLCWEPDAVRAASYLKRALRNSPDEPELIALITELGLQGVDLDEFMVRRSEAELEIIEVEDLEDPETFSDRPLSESGFDRQSTSVSDSPYELLSAAAAADTQAEVAAQLAASGDHAVVANTEAFLEDIGARDEQLFDNTALSQSQDWVPFAPAVDPPAVEVPSIPRPMPVSNDTDDAIGHAAAELERQLAMQDSGLHGMPPSGPFDVPPALHSVDDDDDDLDDLFLDPDEVDLSSTIDLSDEIGGALIDGSVPIEIATLDVVANQPNAIALSTPPPPVQDNQPTRFDIPGHSTGIGMPSAAPHSPSGFGDNGQVSRLDLPPLPSQLPKSLTDDLRELEFYSAAGLRDEAQTLLFELTTNFPEHAQFIMERMEKIREQVDLPAVGQNA